MLKWRARKGKREFFVHSIPEHPKVRRKKTRRVGGSSGSCSEESQDETMMNAERKTVRYEELAQQ